MRCLILVIAPVLWLSIAACSTDKRKTALADRTDDGPGILIEQPDSMLPVINVSFDTGLYARTPDSARFNLRLKPPADELRVSSALADQLNARFGAENLTDFNPATAWVSGADTPQGQYIRFRPDIGNPPRQGFGTPGRFAGICYILNGHNASPRSYTEHARVKQLKVYMNDIAFTFVRIRDTNILQRIDLRLFFYNRATGNYRGRPELTPDDRITFEITDIYRGSKYDDVAVSELLSLPARPD